MRNEAYDKMIKYLQKKRYNRMSCLCRNTATATRSYRSLIESGVLYREVTAIEMFVRAGHVLVPQSYLCLIANVERLLHLLLYTLCQHAKHSFLNYTFQRVP